MIFVLFGDGHHRSNGLLSDARKAELAGVGIDALVAGYRTATAVFSRGSSAYRGVGWDKKSGKWRSEIRLYNRIRLGSFEKEAEAAAAYDCAARRINGDRRARAPPAVLYNTSHKLRNLLHSSRLSLE